MLGWQASFFKTLECFVLVLCRVYVFLALSRSFEPYFLAVPPDTPMHRITEKHEKHGFSERRGSVKHVVECCSATFVGFGLPVHGVLWLAWSRY